MKQIDGLSCTWDFQNRLVGVEDASMRAEYRYDYTGRRIIKRVLWKHGEPQRQRQHPPSDRRPLGNDNEFLDEA
jgi:YD repeat-containing protein